MNQLSFDSLREANTERAIEWMGGPPNDDDVHFFYMELMNEGGELGGVIKKIERFNRGMAGSLDPNDPLVQQELRREIADVIITVDNLANALGIDPSECVPEKFNHTSVKHGFKTRL